MPSHTTETCIYVSQTGTKAHDGWAGFVIGRQYELRYELRGSEVAIVLEHMHEAWELVVSARGRLGSSRLSKS